MYWLCMIATIPLATGNKLNCFISASGMLAIVCCFVVFCVCFLLIFYMLINHLLNKKKVKICHNNNDNDNKYKKKIHHNFLKIHTFIVYNC